MDIPAPSGAEPPANAASLHFDLKAVTVDGVHALPAGAVAETYRDYVGKAATLSDLYAIANAITALYVKAGYALSFAVVPAQTIDATGVARIDAVEGFVADVQIDDDLAPIKSQLQSYAAQIMASRPLRSEDLERFLLLSNDISGAKVKGIFAPVDSDERGASRLILTGSFKRYSGDVLVDNRGSRALGPYRATVDVAVNSLFGISDTLSLRLLQTFQLKELSFGVGQWSAPIDDNGTLLYTNLSYSHSKPGLVTLAPVNLRGTGWIGTLGVSHPVWRARASNLLAGIEITGKALDSDVDSASVSRDRIYTAAAYLRYLWNAGYGTTTVDGRIVQGLNVFGATTRASAAPSRSAGTGDYTALVLGISRQQFLWWGFDAVGTVTAQGTTQGLLASEQCGYGGAQYGRGFDEYDIAGDDCLLASAELRYTLPQFVEDIPAVIQLYGFADGGAVRDNGTLPAGDPRVMSATSAGGGIRADIFDRYSASFELAQPIGRDVTQLGNRKLRLFASIEGRF